MNTALHTALRRVPDRLGTFRSPDEATDLPTQDATNLRAVSDCELVAMAERHAATEHRAGLDLAWAEAERRAHDQASDGLAAQIAGYLRLLTEDTEHALADEARTWSRELHRALAGAPSLPAPRPHASHRAVRS